MSDRRYKRWSESRQATVRSIFRKGISPQALDGAQAAVYCFDALEPRRDLAMASGDEVVRFQNVGMRYGLGPEVLRDISLNLKAGSFHFLTGPSGAGKSTLLRLMYLAQRPSRGLITLFGRDVATMPRRDLPAIRRRIGVVFQDFRLIEHLSALDNVALPLRIAGLDEARLRTHVGELLRWVGLEEKLNALPSTLSGGEKQRIAIARAVIGRPDLLLADEPTGNVDDAMAMRLMYLFEELNKIGTAVVIATHSETLVARFRHRRLHLADGALAEPPAAARSGAA
jgi:cell division transport system ATP-binding protein